MSSAPINIPYEKQSELLTGRTCGAACLSMAYRSLGKEVAQTEIWPAISKQNRFGRISSTTHLMAQDALNRGFSAVAIQARHPLQALRLCSGGGIRAILNHRVQSDSPAGHYTVLVDIDSKDVVLHDPLFGAARHLSHAQLLELWLPHIPNSEIVGAVLIAISVPAPPAIPACEFCHTPMRPSVDCPSCGKPIGLEPGAALACMKDNCIARMWNWVCCPTCDYLFSSRNGEGAGAAATAKPAAPDANPTAAPGVDIAKLFAEMDRFTSHVLRIPAAANNPDIRKKLEMVEASKIQFKAAHAAELARRAEALAQVASFQEKAKQRKDAELKKIDDLNTPAPPLDGDALGDAMLKNLGFK
jgi:hypothetical protein